MIRGTNLSDDIGIRLNEAELVFLDEALAAEFSRSTVGIGDLIFTCCCTVGQIGLVDSAASYERYVISNKQMKMTPDPRRVDSLFMYYYLSQPTMVDLVKGQAIGSSVPGFNLGQLRSLPVRIPDLTYQRAIAETLGVLDDKIASNIRVANIAGKLATLTFSGAARGVNFSMSTFADIASVRGGGTPRTGVPEFWNGDVRWATPTDITALTGPYLESTARSITAEGLANCSSPLYPQGSILMTSRATIGAFAIAQVPSAVNQGFIVVNPIDSELSWWFFHEMEDRVDEFVSLANGATFLELSRGRFKQLHVRLAESSRMLEFCGRVAPLHDVARQGLLENRSLANIRDTLLPRLMSGTLRVKDAEKQVEAVV